MKQVYTTEVLEKIRAVNINEEIYNILNADLQGYNSMKGVWNDKEKEMRHPLEKGWISLLNLDGRGKYIAFTKDVPDSLKQKLMKRSETLSKKQN